MAGSKRQRNEASIAKKKLSKRIKRKLKQQCINAVSVNISLPNKERNIDTLRVNVIYRNRKNILKKNQQKRSLEGVCKKVAELDVRSKKRMEYIQSVVGNTYYNYSSIDTEFNFNEQTARIEGVKKEYPHVSPTFTWLPPKKDLESVPVVDGMRCFCRNNSYKPKNLHPSIVKNPIIDKKFTPYGKILRVDDERSFYTKRYSSDPEMMALWKKTPEETVNYYSAPKTPYQLTTDAPNPLKSLSAAEEYITSIRPAPTQKLNVEAMRDGTIKEELIQKIQENQQKTPLANYPPRLPKIPILKRNSKPQLRKVERPGISVPTGPQTNFLPVPEMLSFFQILPENSGPYKDIPAVLEDNPCISPKSTKRRIRPVNFEGYLNSKMNFRFKKELKATQTKIQLNSSESDITTNDILLNPEIPNDLIDMMESDISVSEMMTVYGIIDQTDSSDEDMDLESSESDSSDDLDDSPIEEINLEEDETTMEIEDEQISIASGLSDLSKPQFSNPIDNLQTSNSASIPTRPTFAEIFKAYTL